MSPNHRRKKKHDGSFVRGEGGENDDDVVYHYESVVDMAIVHGVGVLIDTICSFLLDQSVVWGFGSVASDPSKHCGTLTTCFCIVACKNTDHEAGPIIYRLPGFLKRKRTY